MSRKENIVDNDCYNDNSVPNGVLDCRDCSCVSSNGDGSFDCSKGYWSNRRDNDYQ